MSTDFASVGKAIACLVMAQAGNAGNAKESATTIKTERVLLNLDLPLFILIACNPYLDYL